MERTDRATIRLLERVMLRAYFDRSELIAPAPVLAVGGYVSSDEAWANFESAWKDVLDKFGVSMFHMTEFECRHREFKEWPNDKRIAFIGELIELVHLHAMAGVAAAIAIEVYRALVDEDQRALGHPYVMCGLKAVADTLRWVDDVIARNVATGEWEITEAGKSVSIEFVFESGDDGAVELERQLQIEQESGAFAGRIAKVSFLNKRGVGALQVADFAAYETTKQLVRTIGSDERPTRRSLDFFISKTKYLAEYYNSRSMGEILERMRAAAAPTKAGENRE
jgi:hypothetical protein